MAKKAYKLHDQITCPYCGRVGKVINVWNGANGPSYNIIHREEKSSFVGKETGLLVPCIKIMDMCWCGRERVTDGERYTLRLVDGRKEWVPIATPEEEDLDFGTQIISETDLEF